MVRGKSTEEIEQEIVEFLAETSPRVSVRSADRSSTSTPTTTRDTRIEVPGDFGIPLKFVLRPAKVTTSYEGRQQTTTARRAARATDAWFVLDAYGTYLGALQMGSGPEPWSVRRVQQETSSVGPEGVTLRQLLRTGRTWREAVARGWWALE